MAADPNIILDYKPAQIAPPESPLAAYGQVLGVANAAQNLQAGQQKLQSNALELQQQQRAVDYQKAFTGSVQKHTTQNADGSLSTDWSGIQGDITNAGYGPEALALNKNILEAKEAGLKLIETQHLADQAKVAGFASALNSLPPVDPKAPGASDQIAAFNGAFPNVLANSVQKGVITPQQAQQYGAMFQQGGNTWTPQLQMQIDGAKNGALTAQQAIEHGSKLIDQAREQTQVDSVVTHNKAETAKINAEMADKAKSDAAALLSNATSAADYDAKKATVDPKVAAQLPDSKGLDFSDDGIEGTRDKILKSGMNAEQVANYEQKKISVASLAAAREANSIARQTSNDIRLQMLQGKPNPAQVQASKEIDKLQTQENPLWSKLAQLNSALGDGSKSADLFIPEKGEQPVKMSVKSGGDDDTAKQLTADMVARRNAIASQLKGFVKQKYDLGAKNGAEPTVPLQDVLDKIDAAVPGQKADPVDGQTQEPNPGPAKTPRTLNPAANPADAVTLQGYLKQAGWTGGAPTAQQKAKAAQLAKADNYQF
jgi:hypothetical protein